MQQLHGTRPIVARPPRRIAALLGALLTASAFATLPAGAQTLTMGVRGGPDSIDPHFSTLGTHAEALRHVFDTLVANDENQQLVPALAVSWKPVDDTTWEFKLREGVKFHDGSELTAEDVKFSIERIPEATGPMSLMIYVKRVKSVEAKDKHTVLIKTDGPAATLPNDFVRLFVVSHKIGKEARNPEFNSGKAAVGTGPYRFVSWQPKGDFVVERFDDYWGGKGPWARVVRKEIGNDAARVAALKAGQVDIANYIPATDYQAMQRDRRIKVIKGDSVYVFSLTPNFREPLPKPVKGPDGAVLDKNPFRDAKVREALDLAIDRNTMVNVVLEGLARPANQLMPASFFGSSPRIPERKFDAARAKQLLAEAGFPNGFEVDLYCTNDRLPGDGAVCAALGQMFARIGVKANVNAISRTVFFPAQSKGEYSLWMSGWGTLTGEASYTLGSLIHSNDETVKLGAFNRGAYSNPEIDKVIQEASRTLDDAKRRALFEKAMEMSMADRAAIPIVVLQTVWGMQADKVDYTPRVDEETLAFLVRPVKK